MDLLLRLTKELKPLSSDRFLLGVSGGLDSMALLLIFCHFREHFDFSFAVAHIHHGPSDDSAIQDYRFKSWQFIEQFCKETNLEFFSNYSGSDKESFLKSFPGPLSSEEDFRNLRRDYLGKIKKDENFDWSVFAHHQDDLLETRLLRLIRGVGPEGLESMVVKGDGVLRPLLGVSRKELKEYLSFKKQSWIDDPSNEDEKYLRNWVRKNWLPQLEEKQPGSVQSLSRSLDLILESCKSQSVPLSCIQEGEIILSEFLLLSKESKSQVLATYMKDQGLKNYGLSHIKEILKRLDSEKKSLTFQLLGRVWTVDAGRMKVQGLG